MRLPRHFVLVLTLATLAGMASAQGEPVENPNATDAARGASNSPSTVPSNGMAPSRGMADEMPRPEPGPKSGPGGNEEEQDARAYEVEGYLSTWARFENAGNENVLRLFADLNTDVHVGGDSPFMVRVNGRLQWTVTDKPIPGDLLYGYWDTFSGVFNGLLYELYVDVPDLVGEGSSVIAGRQFIDEGIYLQFDGARADLRLNSISPDLRLSVYGGLGVASSNVDGSQYWMAGVIAKGKLAQWNTRWRLQYLYVNEDFEGINDPIIDPLTDPASYPGQTLNDHLFGATVWQPLGRRAHLYGRFTLLNGRANELHLRYRTRTEEGEWTFLLEWYQLFQRLYNVTNDLTPYVPLLGSLDPFFRASARATWRPRGDMIVELGGAWRQLATSGDESAFNREWFNYYVSGTWLDLWKEKMDLTVAANGYATEADTQNVLTTSLDIRLRERLRLSIGIDYALYKYDWFSNTERENVWTYHAGVRWDINDSFRAVFDLSVDDDRVTTWTSFLARLTWAF